MQSDTYNETHLVLFVKKDFPRKIIGLNWVNGWEELMNKLAEYQNKTFDPVLWRRV